jgi:hypothetical protein
VSDTEPNEENASNSLRLSSSMCAEPWPSAVAADCAANSWRELARIASASCFIASTSPDRSSARRQHRARR